MDWHITAFALGFIALDLLTGFAQAVANKTVDSTKMRNGLWHKCGFVLTMLLAALIEWAMPVHRLGIHAPAVRACVRVHHAHRNREHLREYLRTQSRARELEACTAFQN